ncbi:MAG TPA: efflux RND transporter periplasmic adaptor subunit [Candidatus Cloacimonadota bacterium]|nr:efflux RND transporter periplasmic adaptor subunit [Candidatus Cloacimonadota bacterium]
MKKYLFIILSLSMIILACGKKEVVKASSMEDLYKEQGVPVKVQTVESQEFNKQNTYNCVLSGIHETPVYAMVGDQVEKIHVKIGSHVKKDQIIMEFPVSNPSASYRQAQAAFTLSKQTYDRMKNLYKSGGVAKQDLDGAETQYKVNEANLEAVQQAVKVKAPIDGIITDINVKTAQKVNPGDLLCTVAQLSSLKGRIWLTESEIIYAKTGMPLTLNWNNQTFNGKISDIALSMNPDKKAFGVDIIVNNVKNQLKSGINGEVLINLVKKSSSIMIPRNLIQKDENQKQYVYLADNGKAVKQYVETGLENNLDIEIINGLKSGDILIIEGYNIVEPDQKINVIQ